MAESHGTRTKKQRKKEIRMKQRDNSKYFVAMEDRRGEDEQSRPYLKVALSVLIGRRLDVRNPIHLFVLQTSKTKITQDFRVSRLKCAHGEV
jgi:hypothetical protein